MVRSHRHYFSCSSIARSKRVRQIYFFLGGYRSNSLGSIFCNCFSLSPDFSLTVPFAAASHTILRCRRS